MDKADEGREYAQRKARELRDRADDLVERGKNVVQRQKDSVSAAVEAGRTLSRRKNRRPVAPKPGSARRLE